MPSSKAKSAPKIWLASSSPRRSQLLQMLGVPFERVASTYEEPEPTAQDHASPHKYVLKLAEGKARSVHWSGDDLPPDFEERWHIVLAADTIVWHEGQILNKPRDEAEARAMLKKLCGSSHRVLTGVCVFDMGTQSDPISLAYEETSVHFAPRDDRWIARYVVTGEPMDKAGAYAAQGMGALMIEKIEGDFFNVVGLPLFRLCEMLRAQGVEIGDFWNGASLKAARKLSST